MTGAVSFPEIFLVLVVLAFPVQLYFRSHLRYRPSKGMPSTEAVGWSRGGLALDTAYEIAMDLLVGGLAELGRRVPARQGNVASVVVGNAWVRTPRNVIVNVVGAVESQQDGKQVVLLAARPRLSYGVNVFALDRNAQLVQQVSDSITQRATERGIQVYALVEGPAASPPPPPVA